MQRIVVTVAPVHDCRYPIVLDPVRKRVDPASLRWVLNPQDTVALEQALRIKDQNPHCPISVVSIGPPEVEPILRECLAAGADDVVRVWEAGIEETDAHGIAAILADTMRALSFRLVLMGCKRADMELAQTGSILAELLEIPQITSARNIAPSSDLEHIRLEKRSSGSLLTMSCPLPALVSVDRGPALRYPRFPDRRRAWRQAIQVLDLKALGMTEVPQPLVRVERFTPPKPKRRSTLGADAGISAAARIQRVMSGGAQTRKESNIRSCPDAPSTLKAVEQMLQEKLIVLP